MDEVDRAIATLRPASWKAYTLGAPFYPPSNFSWRLDDEKLMYPFYEKSLKAGINIICIHKGIMPKDYEEAFPGTWQHATPDDVGKAAKDWPQMRFVIYHSAIRPFAWNTPEQEMAEFDRNGYIRWVTDLARIPEQYGVSNVYGEIGTTFAGTCVTNPRFCAAVLGQLVNMMGADHVVWGTDSVFWGSPQWQIEAMRRIEIPDDMLKKHRWQPLGGPDSPTKQAIFGLNSARLYNYNVSQAQGPAFAGDKLAAIKQEHAGQGIERSNAYYGRIAKTQQRHA
jgi:predicted TIM-barrel fold metal-dependent hydrolase